MSSEPPGVSVVVAVFNAEATIERCIDAILAQDYPTERRELIVTDNGSTDNTRSILERYQGRLVLVDATVRGVAAARNAGIRRARYEYLAFTDADCVPQSDWLRRLVAQIDEGATFIAGRVIGHADAGPIERWAEHVFDQASAVRYDPPYAATANLFVAKSVVLDVGSFDETLLRGQDVDLCYRAFFDHGATFTYEEHAVVRHSNPKTLIELFALGVKHGRATADVLRKHGQRLGVSLSGRCLEPARYRTILRGFARHAWRHIRGVKRGDEVEYMAPVCSAVFEAGKQYGLLAHAVRPGRGRPRVRD